MENHHEAHVPTEQSSPPQDARLSRAHADEERTTGPEAAAGQGSQAFDRVTPDQRFRPPDRIRKRSEYKTIYDKGQRIPSSHFVLFVMRNTLGRPRLGITVTKRVGVAVRRNRAKRLLREIFRRHKSELAHVDIVVNGRPSLPGAMFRELEAEFLARLRPFRRRSA